QLQQVLAGRALVARGFLVIIFELALEHAVDAAQLLLLAQLQAVVRHAAATLAVLAGRVGALVHRAALGEALLAFQEQLAALAAAQAALGIGITRHWFSSTPDGAWPNGSRCAESGSHRLCC